MKIFNYLMRIAQLLAAVSLIGCGQEGLVNSKSTVVGLEQDYNYVCNYFVNSVIGDDENDGRSVSAPWKSFDKAILNSRNAGYNPGDAICFQRGQRFFVSDGRLGNGSSGTPGKYIFYGAYGDSNLSKPVISPALKISRLSNWENVVGNLADVGFGISNPAEWLDQSGGVYLWPNYHASWQSIAFWEDTVLMKEASSHTLTNGDWYLEPNVGLYYRSSNGALPNTHELLFAKKAGVFSIHQANNLVIADLAFEYAETGLTGNYISSLSVVADSIIPVHHIAIINNTFSYMRTAIDIHGGVVNKGTPQEVKVEPHDIDISNNVITDIRYAIRLHTDNTTAGFKHIKITGNTIRNIAVGGAYIPDAATDVEAITLQNSVDTLISKNDLRVGLKKVEGHIGPFGARFSTAIIIWRHQDITLRNIIIEKNFISDVSRGINIGAGSTDSMKNVVIKNNISINNEIGFKLNNMDSTNTYVFAYNTAYNNVNSFELAPIKGQVTIGNLSVNPKSHHVVVHAAGGISNVDFNVFIPDKTFLIDAPQGGVDTTYNSFSEWKQSFLRVDENSFTALTPQFDALSPSDPVDFKLSEASVAVDRVVESITGTRDDFGSFQRLIGGVNDVGAWER